MEHGFWSILVSAEVWFPSKIRKALCLCEGIKLSRLSDDRNLPLFACILCTLLGNIGRQIPPNNTLTTILTSICLSCWCEAESFVLEDPQDSCCSGHRGGRNTNLTTLLLQPGSHYLCSDPYQGKGKHWILMFQSPGDFPVSLHVCLFTICSCDQWVVGKLIAVTESQLPHL